MLRSLLSVNYSLLCISIGLLFFMQSCDTPRYVYSAPTQNIPHLTKRGDFTAAAFISAGSGSSSSSPKLDHGFSRGSDLQGAYAISNKIGLMLNRFSRSENKTSTTSNNGDLTLAYRRTLTEYGVGYLFPKKIAYSNTYFQVFAGAATGKFSINENGFSNSQVYTRFHNSNITKLFIQPAVILAPGNFSAAFSSRFCSVKYRGVSTDYNAFELKDYFLDNLSSSPVFFWEPVTDISYDVLKHKGLRFELQMGIVVLLNKKFVDYRTLNLGVGVKVDNNLFKKKANTTKSASAISIIN